MKTNLEDLIYKLVNKIVFLVVMLLLLVSYIIFDAVSSNPSPKNIIVQKEAAVIVSPEMKDDSPAKLDTASIPKTKEGKMIRYGYQLIVNTAKYLGPNGSVGHFTNGMNCQNCHLEAGTKTFGNNYLSVHATYPKFRDRSGNIETEQKRISDCMERSLNGKAIPAESKEMLAILAYLRWVGTGTPVGDKVKGSGLKDLAFLDRAADPAKGKITYDTKCKSCHMENGEGQKNKLTNIGFTYPPLWGNDSYNTGAGLYRVTTFAKYIKYNMPFGASHEAPQLSDEEAWDLAAYVNSQPRPKKDLSEDWPDIAKKPIDHPFGPYTDQFSEAQHKFGPFKPIEEAKEKAKKNS